MTALATVMAQGRVQIDLNLPGILALLAGILILVFPRVLNYIVAVYLIVLGIILTFNL